jgi:hypothetical protein
MVGSYSLMLFANTTRLASLLTAIIAIGAEILKTKPAHILGSTVAHSQ